MSLLSSWGKEKKNNELVSLTAGKIANLSESELEKIFFEALRGNEIGTIRSILQVKRSLLKSKLFGYEGRDVYDLIPNSKTKRCYTYTGKESDGYFYPLHVAAESGHKALIMLLVQAGADQNILDYRNETPQQKCTGDGMHAFYELQGLRLPSEERYEGQFDRNGCRSKQGSLFYKAEGYHETRHLLYRGGWKENKYHGHGSLYHPSSSVLKYFGRFRNGLFHGVGTLHDLEGDKIYQGNFREGLRDGRGEEFVKGKMVYKGEMAGDVRHGFGIAVMSEGHRFMGHYERGVMTGVGVYYMPNGDRYEGMFLNNKRDGPGSFYKKDPVTGEQSALHSVYSMGRKDHDVDVPFIPKISDIPSLVGKPDVKKRFMKGFDDDTGNAPDDWKSMLGSFVRITPADAEDLDVKEELKDVIEIIDGNANEEEFMYHDVDETHGDFRNIPDFEQIYHLVIDAVDEYNEKWEKEWKLQETSMLEAAIEAERALDLAKEQQLHHASSTSSISDSKASSATSFSKAGSAAKTVTKDKTNPQIASSNGEKDEKPGTSLINSNALTQGGKLLRKTQSADLDTNKTQADTKPDLKNEINSSLLSLGSKMLKKPSGDIQKVAPVVRGPGEQTKAKKLLFMNETERKEEELRNKHKNKKNKPLLDPAIEHKLGLAVLEKLEEEIVKELEMEVDMSGDDLEAMGIDQIIEGDNSHSAITGEYDDKTSQVQANKSGTEDSQKWSALSKITNFAPTFTKKTSSDIINSRRSSEIIPRKSIDESRSSNVGDQSTSIIREVGIIEDRMDGNIDLGKVRTGRKNRRTSRGTVIVINEFASEILYLMRTASDLLMAPVSSLPSSISS